MKMIFHKYFPIKRPKKYSSATNRPNASARMWMRSMKKKFLDDDYWNKLQPEEIEYYLFVGGVYECPYCGKFTLNNRNGFKTMGDHMMLVHGDTEYTQ
jgi:hypothetical protein